MAVIFLISNFMQVFGAACARASSISLHGSLLPPVNTDNITSLPPKTAVSKCIRKLFGWADLFSSALVWFVPVVGIVVHLQHLIKHQPEAGDSASLR